jgi:cell division protein FtsB
MTDFQELKQQMQELEKEKNRLKANVKCLRLAREIYEFLDSHRRTPK